MNDELLREVQRWRRFAVEDLEEAERQINCPDTVPRHPAWLAQQAAEKALKAVLVALQVEFPFTHNLNTLHDRLPESWKLNEVDADLARLSEYAVESRYPSDWPEISHEEAHAAVQDARLLVETIQVKLHAYLPEP